ncbi:Frag1/DRAM/Sfk1 [Aphelenchoides avenae]|nr:Frag1/DRAM/Sfk1 [Aphelenchus avenae]
MFLNLTTFLSALIISLRYSLVVELNRSSDLLLKATNRLAFYAGLLGALGMFIVANFQETAVIQFHLTGAFMCFGCGCIYMIIQTWITYRMHPLFVNRRIAYIRGAIALVSSVCFVLAVVLGVMASKTFHKYYPDVPSPRPWRQHHPPLPGYDLHCISAVAEWTCAILNVCFLLSYSRDFEKIRVQLGVQPLVAHLDQSPMWPSTADLTASP